MPVKLITLLRTIILLTQPIFVPLVSLIRTDVFANTQTLGPTCIQPTFFHWFN